MEVVLVVVILEEEEKQEEDHSKLWCSLHSCKNPSSASSFRILSVVVIDHRIEYCSRRRLHSVFLGT